jgi:hypothetical protein
MERCFALEAENVRLNASYAAVTETNVNLNMENSLLNMEADYQAREIARLYDEKCSLQKTVAELQESFRLIAVEHKRKHLGELAPRFDVEGFAAPRRLDNIDGVPV